MEFCHIVSILKACNYSESLRNRIGELDIGEISDRAEELLDLILANTDRVFLPTPVDRKAALKLMEVSLQNNKNLDIQMENAIEKSIMLIQDDIGKDMIKDKESAVTLAFVVCLMDDALNWYITKSWEGPKFHLDVLEIKYKARELYRTDKEKYSKEIKLLLGKLSKADLEMETKNFYSKM